MAGIVTAKGPHASHDLGMHTEGLRGRTQQRFFDITEENVGFAYPGTETEVLSGLKEGDLVITGPFDSVRGMYVGDPVKTAPKPGANAAK